MSKFNLNFLALFSTIIAIAIAVFTLCTKKVEINNTKYDPWTEEFDPWEDEEEEEVEEEESEKPTIFPIIPSDEQTKLESSFTPNRATAEIRSDGRFYQDGYWHFLKIGKCIGNFSNVTDCNKVSNRLDFYKSKGYNCIVLICYWNNFDVEGRGEVPASKFNNLVTLCKEIKSKGMYACIAVETYSIGGSYMPTNFFKNFPNARAMDVYGNYVIDDEYGTFANVPSIYSDEYTTASRNYIKNVVLGLKRCLDCILYFETTVEPQYMGNQKLDYSPTAIQKYHAWLDATGLPDKDIYFNIFRGEYLAKWVSGDAKAFKDAWNSEECSRYAKGEPYVAIDYLSANNMSYRIGDENAFIANLTDVDIIQINWHYRFDTGTINNDAYDRVWKFNNEMSKGWAISEHMTFNGSDYSTWNKDKTVSHLKNVISKSTKFGFEFVNILPSSDNFSVYNSSMSPKSPLSYVESDWETYWLPYIWNNR